MALSVVYTVVNGVVYSEDRGGTVTDYRPDTLGSTAALTQGNTVTATYVYWPYGEVRAKTGSGTTNFTYVGTLGYYNDTSLRTYVRARHYRQNAGRWMTVDPLWPAEGTYSYSLDRPITLTDRTGLIVPLIVLALIAGIISCLISLGISLVRSQISGEDGRVAWCKGGTKCLANGLAAGIGVVVGIAQPELACGLAIAASLVGLLADSLCPCIAGCCKAPSLCDLLKAAFSAAAGCAGFFGVKDEIINWVGSLLSWFAKELARYAGGVLSGILASVIGGFGKIACDWAPGGPKGGGIWAGGGGGLAQPI